MRSPEARQALASISSDIISLHESFQATPGIEVESTAGSIIGDEAFDFDSLLINTTLYRKAFARRIRVQQGKIQEAVKVERTGVPVPDTSPEPSSWLMLESNTKTGASRPQPATTPNEPMQRSEKPSNTNRRGPGSSTVQPEDWNSPDCIDLTRRNSVNSQLSADTVLGPIAPKAEDKSNCQIV
jgi:hypothetical protein